MGIFGQNDCMAVGLIKFKRLGEIEILKLFANADLKISGT